MVMVSDIVSFIRCMDIVSCIYSNFILVMKLSSVSFWWWSCLQSLVQRLVMSIYVISFWWWNGVISILLCDIYSNFILVVKLLQFHFGGEAGYSLLSRDWWCRCYAISFWWWNSAISILLLCDIYSIFILVVKLLQFHFDDEAFYILLHRDC